MKLLGITRAGGSRGRIVTRALGSGAVVAVLVGGMLVLGEGVASAQPTAFASRTINVLAGQNTVVNMTNATEIPGVNPGDVVAVIECNGNIGVGDPNACDTNQSDAALGAVAPDGSLGSGTAKHPKVGIKKSIQGPLVGDGYCGVNTANATCVLLVEDVQCVVLGGPITCAIQMGAVPVYYKVATVRLSQSTLIGNGQPVQVVGKSLPPNDTNLVAVECGPELLEVVLGGGDPTQACDTAFEVPVTSSANGSVRLKVFTLLTTSYSDALGGSCAGGVTCYVAIGDATTLNGGIASFQSAPGP
ncbi:MAG TPA: hypothetical protein VK277_08425 [Acidimicrobiales bacterium]|nr:hypothetical protein [Acidimicrobiales bacterium]